MLFGRRALLGSASATLVISSPLVKTLSTDLISITNSSLEAPPGYLQNLTYSPWPAQPYSIPLDSRTVPQYLIINHASKFHGSRPVSVPMLQEFLREFRDNLEHESPVPGFAPRKAAQSNIDIQSYTKWLIDINEGIFGYRLPTELAMITLDEIARLVGSHGPSNMFFGIRTTRFLYTYGFLIIEEFGGASLNETVTNANSISQIS